MRWICFFNLQIVSLILIVWLLLLVILIVVKVILNFIVIRATVLTRIISMVVIVVIIASSEIVNTSVNPVGQVINWSVNCGMEDSVESISQWIVEYSWKTFSQWYLAEILQFWFNSTQYISYTWPCSWNSRKSRNSRSK